MSRIFCSARLVGATRRWRRSLAFNPVSSPLKEAPVKFLVLWRLDVGRPGPELIKAIAEQPNYGKKLEADGKLECRYHLIGQHGGAWIYKVKSNEELDLLLAMAPVYNYARYEVLALADMNDTASSLGKLE